MPALCAVEYKNNKYQLLNIIKGTTAGKLLLDQLTKFESDFKYLKAKIFLDPSLEFNMTLRQYIKCRTMIHQRRQMKINGNTGEDLHYLNPFTVDMIPVGVEANCGWERNITTNQMELRSTKPLKSGEALVLA